MGLLLNGFDKCWLVILVDNLARGIGEPSADVIHFITSVLEHDIAHVVGILRCIVAHQGEQPPSSVSNWLLKVERIFDVNTSVASKIYKLCQECAPFELVRLSAEWNYFSFNHERVNGIIVSCCKIPTICEA